MWRYSKLLRLLAFAPLTLSPVKISAASPKAQAEPEWIEKKES